MWVRWKLQVDSRCVVLINWLNQLQWKGDGRVDKRGKFSKTKKTKWQYDREIAEEMGEGNPAVSADDWLNSSYCSSQRHSFLILKFIFLIYCLIFIVSFCQSSGIIISQGFDICPFWNLILLRLLMHFYCKEVTKDEFLKIEKVRLLPFRKYPQRVTQETCDKRHLIRVMIRRHGSN